MENALTSLGSSGWQHSSRKMETPLTNSCLLLAGSCLSYCRSAALGEWLWAVQTGKWRQSGRTRNGFSKDVGSGLGLGRRLRDQGAVDVSPCERAAGCRRICGRNSGDSDANWSGRARGESESDKLSLAWIIRRTDCRLRSLYLTHLEVRLLKARFRPISVKGPGGK